MHRYRILMLVCALVMFMAGFTQAMAGDELIFADEFAGKGAEGYSKPQGWSWFGGWGRVKNVDCTGGITQKNGSGVLALPAPAEGVSAGWSGRSFERDKAKPGICGEVNVYAAKNTSNMSLRLFLAWFDGAGKFIDTSTLLVISSFSADPEKKYSFELLGSMIPSDAVKCSVNIAVSQNGSETACGEAFVDNLSLRYMNSLPLALAPAKFASWWVMGEPVVYKLSSTEWLPESMSALLGVVRDSAGREVAQVKVARDTLLQQGWSWQAQSPGFYDVSFSWLDKDGKSTPVIRSYRVQPHEGKYRAIGDPVDIVREMYTFVVADRKTRPGSARPWQFGACEHVGKHFTQRVKIADLLGLSFVRMCFIEWHKIEPVKGEFRWDEYDGACCTNISILNNSCGVSKIGVVRGLRRQIDGL